MASFYFEQVLQRGLNGIDQQGITGAVIHIAGVVLVASVLWGAYESYSNGGDVRQLGLTSVKYLVIGLLFVNYQSTFRIINSAFNGVADGLNNLSGGVDIIVAWENSLSQAWNTDSNWFSALWNWATGGVSAIVAGLITVVGYVLLPFTYTFFTLLYVLYGAILYVLGPLVLALIPARGVGGLGRAYCANIIVFQCWGLLYAILQVLMSGLQIANPLQAGTSFLQAFVGAGQVIVISFASVLLSIMIAIIPLIASRIVRGDVGSTMMSAISGALSAGAILSGLSFHTLDGVVRGQLKTDSFPPPQPSQASFRGGQGSDASAAVRGPDVRYAVGESRAPVAGGVQPTQSCNATT